MDFLLGEMLSIIFRSRMGDFHQSVVASVQITLLEANANGNDSIAIDAFSFMCQRNFSFLVKDMTGGEGYDGCEQ